VRNRLLSDGMQHPHFANQGSAPMSNRDRTRVAWREYLGDIDAQPSRAITSRTRLSPGT
jgi:hypothetical protein